MSNSKQHQIKKVSSQGADYDQEIAELQLEVERLKQGFTVCFDKIHKLQEKQNQLSQRQDRLEMKL